LSRLKGMTGTRRTKATNSQPPLSTPSLSFFNGPESFSSVQSRPTVRAARKATVAPAVAPTRE